LLYETRNQLGLIDTFKKIRGTFDPYTGVFGWIIEKEGSATFSNGQIDKANNVAMYWPPAPDIFGAFMTDYVPETFKRK
jgi:hypothetical protein